MSDYISPNYTKKQLNLQNVNTYCAIHDLNCHCKEPLKHIIKQIVDQEPTIKPWLATITADGGKDLTDDVIDHFGPGELEAIFAEGDATDER